MYVGTNVIHWKERIKTPINQILGCEIHPSAPIKKTQTFEKNKNTHENILYIKMYYKNMGQLLH